MLPEKKDEIYMFVCVVFFGTFALFSARFFPKYTKCMRKNEPLCGTFL